MSGDASGLIIGAIGLIVAPYIIAGAAIAAIGYGAWKVSSYLADYGKKYEVEKKNEKQLEINNCSVKLDDVYKKMRAAASTQEKAHIAYAKHLEKKFNDFDKETKKIDVKKIDTCLIDSRINRCKEDLKKIFDASCEHIKKKMEYDYTNAINSIHSTLEQSLKDQEDIVNWLNQTNVNIQIQKNACSSMLRDALASIKVLENMKNKGVDIEFENSLLALQASYNRASSDFDKQAYQSAFASAKKVVRDSAILSSKQVQTQFKMDNYYLECMTRYLRLKEEMERIRYFEFEDKNGQLQKCDLNKFSHNKFKKMLETIDGKIENLDNLMCKGSSFLIEKEIKNFDNELEPEAQHIVKMAQVDMADYYDRMYVLENLANEMKKQGYTFNWVMPEGKDFTRNLVANFQQAKSQNTVSIALDTIVDDNQQKNMNMEVMTFYDNGRPISETDKQQLRNDLMNALHNEGLIGTLNCSGNVHQSSNNVDYKNKEKVSKM